MSQGNPRDVVANALNCDILVSDFELQLRNYFHFQTNTLREGMNPLIQRARD